MPKSASGAGPDTGEGKEWCRKAREDCIARKAQCGRDCPHALESMDWSCMVKSTTQVRKALRGETAPVSIQRRNSKHTEQEIWAMLDDLASGMSRRVIEAKYKIDRGSLCRLAKGEIWADVHQEWHRAKESA